MPLSNAADTYFVGTLVDGLGDRAEEYRDQLKKSLEARQIPKSTIKIGTVNMWWRKDSLYMDVKSTLDGDITSTIHFQPYGRSLFIGRAFRSQSDSNYYKRMANAAFLRTIEDAVSEALDAMAGSSPRHEVVDERPLTIKPR